MLKPYLDGDFQGKGGEGIPLLHNFASLKAILQRDLQKGNYR